MATLDDLLAEEASSGERSLDDLLADEGAAPVAPTASASEREQRSPSQTDVPWHKRAATGFMDPLVGAGQLGQHALPEKVSDFLRSPRATSIAGVFPVVGAAHMLLNAPAGGKQGVNTGDVDAAVAERERSYQSSREGKEGMDWWRVGGAV